MPKPLLQADQITKVFPGVKALDQVSFDLRPGEVHVLFGENGAGKSTLIKVLAGSYQPDGGQLYLEGRPVEFKSPFEAVSRGISAVYQEFSLVPQMTVVENIFLGLEMGGRGFIDQQAMDQKARAALADLGFNLDLKAKVGDLTRAERQMVEIAKALQRKLSVLILDEPTASLSDKEVTRLFELIKKLTAEGVGVVYISHRIDELKKVGDRITVLRDGRHVETLEMAEADEERLISLMTGREYQEVFPEMTHRLGVPILTLKDVSTASGLEDISLEVRTGEILGVAGLVGSGKSRLGRALFGLDPIVKGSVRLYARRLEPEQMTPASSLAEGIYYFPSDRHKEGLVLCRSVRENQTLASLEFLQRGPLLDLAGEKRLVDRIIAKMNVRPARMDQTINHLSGGNQQKVMLARGLTREVKVYIFDEASCGIDVGAKREVYHFIQEQAEAGAAVIFISSELPEVLHLSHRIVVMHGGRVANVLDGGSCSEEDVLAGCFGYRYQDLLEDGAPQTPPSLGS